MKRNNDRCLVGFTAALDRVVDERMDPAPDADKPCDVDRLTHTLRIFKRVNLCNDPEARAEARKGLRDADASPKPGDTWMWAEGRRATVVRVRALEVDVLFDDGRKVEFIPRDWRYWTAMASNAGGVIGEAP